MVFARPAIKEPEEIVFLFFCIALGLALGAEYYELALSGTLVFSVFVMLRHSNARKQTPAGLLLTIQGAEAEIYVGGSDQMRPLLAEFAPDYTVQRFEIEGEGGEVRELRESLDPEKTDAQEERARTVETMERFLQKRQRVLRKALGEG